MASSHSNTWAVNEIAIANYLHKGYGAFLGEVDVIFPPGCAVRNFHIFVSKGKVRVGVPQDPAHNDLCWFTSPVTYAQFEARILDLLRADPGFVASLHWYGLQSGSGTRRSHGE